MFASTDPMRLIDSLAAVPMPMVVSNPRLPDNPLEYVNPAFCALTGYSTDEILGRNCRFLTGEGTEVEATRRLAAAIGERRSELVDILNYRRDGSAFRNGVMITPIFNADEQVQWFLGSQVDLGGVSTAFIDRCAAARGRVANLSPRQRQILELMAAGLLNKQIAWKLGISEKTVKMHRSLLLDRLEVATSAEAIRIAVEAGL